MVAITQKWSVDSTIYYIKKKNPNKLNPLGSKMKWLAQNGVEVKKEQDYRRSYGPKV